MVKKTFNLVLTLLIFSIVVGDITNTNESPAKNDKIKFLKLEPGLEYADIYLKSSTLVGDKILHVLRVNTEIANLKMIIASELDNKLRTAAKWLKDYNLTAAINLGMFQQDYKSNVGYLKNISHINNPRWSKSYKSVLAFNPKKKGIKKATMFDLDKTDKEEILKNYKSIVQNLRLIKSPGKNVWNKNSRKWSEAAVAQDKNGNILFIFCSSPYMMYDFNILLLNLPLQIEMAMHMEGGPEASLSIHTKNKKLNLYGIYETDFLITGNNHQWEVPNILGVMKYKK